MAAIARGLMAEPRLLMLDEPSLGLSPLLVINLHEIMQKLRAEHLTLLLVEQNVHLALAVRRAPLRDGEGFWDTHLRRAVLLTVIWAGFLTGAILGGMATPRFGVLVLLLPFLLPSRLRRVKSSNPKSPLNWVSMMCHLI